MSYFATYIINGYRFKFSDFGIILKPGEVELDNPLSLIALKAAFRMYGDINNVCMMGDIGTQNLQFCHDDTVDELLQMATDAESQQSIPLDDHDRDVILKIRDEKRRRDSRQPRHNNAPRQPRSGYVYLIVSEMGQYKIGKTNNPKHRSKMFGLTLPFNVELIHLIETDDMGMLEASLHDRFAPNRINGEWFDLTPEDVSYIKSLGGAS
jgi:hypothetical protein